MAQATPTRRDVLRSTLSAGAAAAGAAAAMAIPARVFASQGAWTALRFATLHPERVARLVLLTPGGIVPDRLLFVVRALPLLLLGEWGLRRLNRLVFGGVPVPREVDDTLVLIGRHFKPRLGRLPVFSDPELARLTMPVLLIVGERDALRDGSRIHARLRRLVPDLVYSRPPNAGHALVGTSAEILRFLEGRNAGAGPAAGAARLRRSRREALRVSQAVRVCRQRRRSTRSSVPPASGRARPPAPPG